MCPGTAVGFFWALGGIFMPNNSMYVLIKFIIAAAEKRELYRFSADLGRLALNIADRHGGSGEKWYYYLLVERCLKSLTQKP
jgi:hypothetical protein